MNALSAMSVKPHRGRRPTLRGDAQALVDVARGLFAKRGYADVGTEEIVRAPASRAGRSTTTSADKQDLFRAVASRSRRRSPGKSAAAALAQTDPGSSSARPGTRSSTPAWTPRCSGSSCSTPPRSWGRRRGARSHRSTDSRWCAARDPVADRRGADRGPAGRAARAPRDRRAQRGGRGDRAGRGHPGRARAEMGGPPSSGLMTGLRVDSATRSAARAEPSPRLGVVPGDDQRVRVLAPVEPDLADRAPPLVLVGHRPAAALVLERALEVDRVPATSASRSFRRRITDWWPCVWPGV